MFPFDIGDLGASFRRYFEIVPALTPELRDEAYRIRHQVYCEELQYEPLRPSGRESDEYDAHSLHCLIRSVKQDRFVGCTRVVLARPGHLLYPLPLERTCARAIDRSILDPLALPRTKIAEVSRLAVISSYRLRRGEQGKPISITDESFGGESLPRFPYIPVGLYLGTVELAALHGVETLLILTEPRLAQHFARLGVEVKRIGAEVEHRGVRVPSAMSVPRIIAGLNLIMRPLYQEIAKEIRSGMEAQKVTL